MRGVSTARNQVFGRCAYHPSSSGLWGHGRKRERERERERESEKDRGATSTAQFCIGNRAGEETVQRTEWAVSRGRDGRRVVPRRGALGIVAGALGQLVTIGREGEVGTLEARGVQRELPDEPGAHDHHDQLPPPGALVSFV